MSTDLLLGLPSKVKTLLDRLTQQRADDLDLVPNIDADTDELLNRLTAERAANLDNLAGGGGGFSPPKALGSWVGNIQYLEDSLGGGQMAFDANQSAGSSWATVLSLVGPGVISVLGVTDGVSSVAGDVDFELTIDGGVPITQTVTMGTNTPSDGFLVVGCATKVAERTGGGGLYAVVPESFQFTTSLVLRLRRPSGTRTFSIYHHWRPV